MTACRYASETPHARAVFRKARRGIPRVQMKSQRLPMTSTTANAHTPIATIGTRESILHLSFREHHLEFPVLCQCRQTTLHEHAHDRWRHRIPKLANPLMPVTGEAVGCRKRHHRLELMRLQHSQAAFLYRKGVKSLRRQECIAFNGSNGPNRLCHRSQCPCPVVAHEPGRWREPFAMT